MTSTKFQTSPNPNAPMSIRPFRGLAFGLWSLVLVIWCLLPARRAPGAAAAARWPRRAAICCSRTSARSRCSRSREHEADAGQVPRGRCPHAFPRQVPRRRRSELDAWVQLMDRNNIAVCVSLDGQWGELLDEHAKLLWTKHNDRFVIFANIDWQGTRQGRRPGHLGLPAARLRPPHGPRAWPRPRSAAPAASRSSSSSAWNTKTPTAR